MTDYSDYTVRISTDPQYYGSSCTNEDAERIYAALSELVQGQFPGIRTERFIDGLSSSATTGPDVEIVDEINRWIENNWTAAM